LSDARSSELRARYEVGDARHKGCPARSEASYAGFRSKLALYMAEQAAILVQSETI